MSPSWISHRPIKENAILLDLTKAESIRIYLDETEWKPRCFVSKYYSAIN